MNWKIETEQLVISDVIEWTEAIWPTNNFRRRKKQRPWGKQKVTGQIIAINADYAEINVLRSYLIENYVASNLIPYKKNTVLIKKRSTLIKNKPTRLLWSEESLRSTLLLPENAPETSILL